jgi:hypothetical protein
VHGEAGGIGNALRQDERRRDCCAMTDRVLVGDCGIVVADFNGLG